MSDDRKYVRVYYNDLIRDYPDVWNDDAALATWLRLLATADPMWPTPPEFPRSVRTRPLRQLVDSTLVEPLPHERYKVKGLDTERTRRAAAGRKGAAMRWDSERNAIALPSRAEPSTSKAEQSARDAVVYFYEKLGRFPSESVRQWIDDLTEEFGSEAVIGALDTEYAKDSDKRTLMGRIRDRLKANARTLGAKERQAEIDANLQRRLDRTRRYLREMRGETA